MPDTNHAQEVQRALYTLTRTQGLSPSHLELAHDLHAEIVARGAGRPVDPYFEHNLAVLVCGLFDSPSEASAVDPLARAAAPRLSHGLKGDPDDLTQALALAYHAKDHQIRRDRMEQLLESSTRPHAGDRLTTAVAEALASYTHQADSSEHAWLATAAQQMLSHLDALLTREPERAPASQARLGLLLVLGRVVAEKNQNDVLVRFHALLQDAETSFGPDSTRDLLRIRALTLQLRRKIGRPTREDMEAVAERAGSLAAEHVLQADDALALHEALRRSRSLRNDVAIHLSKAMETLCAQNPDHPALAAALASTLEATGDQDAVLQHHTEQIRQGNVSEDSLISLARHWIGALRRGEPSGMDAEAELLITRQFPVAAARGLDPNVALLLLEHIAGHQGAGSAAELARTVLLRQRKLGKSTKLVVRAVQMMADAGNPQGALDLGHANLRNADSPDLRLTLAQIHLGAGIQIAEADAVLKPLSSAGGRVAAEARALRQEVQNHPELENERYRSLLTVEEKLGIGQRKPVRCRVLFPSDRYALAEMPNVRAPSFYQHRTLRVMVTPSALPDGVTIDGLKKGVEFTAQVVGEDDHKGDRVRVYWIADNTQIEIIASPKDRGTKERERPAAKSASKERGKAPANSSDEGDREGQPAIDADPALELAYNIGTEKAVLIRIERVHRRGGLLLGRALPPGNPDGEAFPVRVGIHRKFVPEERRDQRWKGSHVLCQIERTNRNGKLCYDGVSMLTMAALETEPSSPAPENHDTEQAELASTEGDAAAPATRDESKAPASSEEPTEQSTASTGNTSSQADAAPTEQTKEEADATEPIADDKNADDKNADDKNADDKNADDKNADDKNADDKNADDKNADDKNVTAQTEEEEACDD